ncbi:MAG TPA: YMGG-like glycine zipper-containing protein [Chitinophagaceae bacterium]|nr:YMGG-like glycine zipper-containing protein [Chitinophagaceae bacterium]
MKKIFTFFAAATIFAACNSNSDLDAKKDVVITDTSAMYNNNASTDIGTPVAQQAPAAVAPTRIIRETRIVYVDRAPKATRRVIREAAPAAPVITTVPQTQSNTGTATQGSGTSGNTGTVGTETAPAEPVKKEKEGWSNAAKDAVIGGVGGAVAGAIISKKKVKGAVIGGVIGAAGGYILGRKKDKAEAEEGAN